METLEQNYPFVLFVINFLMNLGPTVRSKKKSIYIAMYIHIEYTYMYTCMYMFAYVCYRAVKVII